MRTASANAARASRPQVLRLTSLLKLSQTMQVHHDADIPTTLAYLKLPQNVTQNHFTHIVQRIQWLQMQQRLLAQGVGKFLQKSMQTGRGSLQKGGKAGRQAEGNASGKRLSHAMLSQQTWVRWLQILIIKSQARNAGLVPTLASAALAIPRMPLGKLARQGSSPLLTRLLMQHSAALVLELSGQRNRQTARAQFSPGIIAGASSALLLLQRQAMVWANSARTSIGIDRRTSKTNPRPATQSHADSVFSAMHTVSMTRSNRLERILLRLLTPPGKMKYEFAEQGRNLINVMRTHSSVALEVRSGARALIETLLPWYLRSRLRDVGNSLAQTFLQQGAQKRWQRTVMRSHEVRGAAAESMLLRVLHLRPVKVTGMSGSTRQARSTGHTVASMLRAQVDMIWQASLRQYVSRQTGHRLPAYSSSPALGRQQVNLEQPMLRQSDADRASLSHLSRVARWREMASRMNVPDMLAWIRRRSTLLAARRTHPQAQAGHSAMSEPASVRLTLAQQAFGPPLVQPPYQNGMVAQPMELVPYRSRQSVTQVLRETHTNRSWQDGLQVQMQKLIQSQLTSVERTIQMKVVQELTQRNQDVLHQVVVDSLFSPPVMRVLTDRLCSAVEKRTAIEHYRKGAN
ncbi:hypothetical protein ACO0LD_06640 [Undibacterium sp. Ji83W]|uniref:hypothetical protein n=1 Tax=Undibacterium sp. Ji83W TaxID=3413043 RepID=UPI003BEF9E2C